jgi:hypothetical protein
LDKPHGGQAYGVGFNEKRKIALLDLGPMGNGCGGWIYDGSVLAKSRQQLAVDKVGVDT